MFTQPYLRFQKWLQGATLLKNSLDNELRIYFSISLTVRSGSGPCLRAWMNQGKGFHGAVTQP
jgi:hypothetical protein